MTDLAKRTDAELLDDLERMAPFPASSHLANIAELRRRLRELRAEIAAGGGLCRSGG